MSGIAGKERMPWGRIALIWFAVSAFMLIANLRNLAEMRFPDPDDTLRLIQVRDLIAGQGWFDLHQYRINPGDSPIMHWSRLVDIPLLLLIGLLTPLLGQPVAEQFTVAVVPLLLLGGVMAMAGMIAFRHFGKEIAGLACLACGLSPLLLAQLQPLRIDHHGWQAFLAICALAALMHRSPRAGGAWAGFAMACGLSISLELLPLAGAFAGVFWLRWMREPAAKGWLAAYLASLAGSLALLFLVTRGLNDLIAYCDAISPAHLGFFAIVALGGLAAALLPNLRGWAVTALLAAAGIAGLAFYLWQAPQCLSGPFGSLDPLVRDYWYVNVLEGQPFWRHAQAQVLPLILQGLVALGAVLWLWRNAEGELRHWWLDYALLLGAALATGLLVWRSMAFAGAFAAVPLGWLAYRLLRRFREMANPLAKLGMGLLTIGLLMPSSLVLLVKLGQPQADSGNSGQVRASSCELRENIVLLDRFAPATIFAPLDVGPAILERTSHSVVATAHHRAQEAMGDVILAFISDEAEAQSIVAQHGARYLVICSDLGEPRLYARRAPGGLMSQLLEGDYPDWLRPVPMDMPEALKVWEVVDPQEPLNPA